MIVGNNVVAFPEYQMIVARARNDRERELFDTLPVLQHKDSDYAFPQSVGICRILYNLGMSDVLDAAPICFDKPPLVEGKYKPMKHQLRTAAFMTLYSRAHILSEPRLGKTSSVILATDYMQRVRMITGGVLIITTVTTIHGVWKDSILSALPDARIQIAHGAGREQALAVSADYYITNYDSCRLSLDAFMSAITDGRIGAIVIDEMTHVGNAGSQRHKAIYQMCNKSGIRHVWGLTGSPADNPEMVFGMCRCVNPDALPCTTKSGWLALTTYQYGPQPFQRALSPIAKSEIHKAMQPAIRYEKKDIFDLPPVTTQVRMIQLSREQAKYRNELRAQATTLLESGERITAVNGGVLLGKLMQVAMGIVKTSETTVTELAHKERTQAVLEAIGETPRKTVIFCGYIAGIDMLMREIRAAGYTCDKVDGSVTGKQRAGILDNFQNRKAPHVLVCHPATTAMGVELSAADTIIFNGVPLTGGFVYAQSIERLSSTKQKASNINIIHIISTPEERKALDALQKGHDMGKQIAKLFSDFVIDK